MQDWYATEPILCNYCCCTRKLFTAANMKCPRSQEELLAIIGKYDGLVVRSGVTVDEDLIGAANNMRIVGRAGTGERSTDSSMYHSKHLQQYV